MPDLGGSPALDVAITLAAMFLLLSTVLAAINEGIANVLGWRAKTLEDAIRSLVGDPAIRGGLRDVGRVTSAADASSASVPSETTLALFGHWRLKSLVRDPESRLRRRTRPSYVSPQAFSLALAETLAAGPLERESGGEVSPWELADEEILRHAITAAEALPPGQLRSLALKAARNADHTLEGFRIQVERAFDDCMERASGWYKRKVQTVLVVLATLLVVACNVDSVRIATGLWDDRVVGAAVAQLAAEVESPADAAAAVDRLDELGLPLGWGANGPDTPLEVLAALPGWLITIAALQLGAPFWFDLLSRLARLRGSGVPERPRSLNDTAGTLEAERAARRERARDRVSAATRTREGGAPAPR